MLAIFSDYLGIVIIALGLIISGIYRLKIPTGAVGSALVLGCLYLLILFLTDTVEELGIVYRIYAWLAIINGIIWVVYILIASPSSLPSVGPAKDL